MAFDGMGLDSRFNFSISQPFQEFLSLMDCAQYIGKFCSTIFLLIGPAGALTSLRNGKHTKTGWKNSSLIPTRRYYSRGTVLLLVFCWLHWQYKDHQPTPADHAEDAFDHVRIIFTHNFACFPSMYTRYWLSNSHLFELIVSYSLWAWTVAAHGTLTLKTKRCFLKSIR